MESIIIYGAGNAGRKAIESLVRQNRYLCEGFIDNNLPRGSQIQNTQVIGSEKDLDSIYERGIRKAFVAIGNNFLREKIAGLLQKKGYDLVSIIDPFAFVSCDAQVGKGALIMPFAYVGSKAELEDLSVCQNSSIVSLYAKVGRAVNLAPGSILGAYVEINKFCKIGIGAKILNNLIIGERTLIGAGSVVTRNIPENVEAWGVPAKVMRTADLENYNPNATRHNGR